MCVQPHLQEIAMNSTTTNPTRYVDGATLPVAGRWEIDPGHAEVAFIGRHFMITKVRGRFTDVRGSVTIAEDFGASSVDVVIGMASVESGNGDRDQHIRSSELFDVEQYPEASFRSTNVEWTRNRGVVLGDLTIHGVTRSVPLEVTFEGHARDPWGGERAIFSARAQVNREDFGVSWNVALEAGGVLVSKEIRIEIEVETVLQIED
jgi:polyisoprenoid-binding protein YceI